MNLKKIIGKFTSDYVRILVLDKDKPLLMFYSQASCVRREYIFGFNSLLKKKLS